VNKEVVNEDGLVSRRQPDDISALHRQMILLLARGAGARRNRRPKARNL
jgi:hypothetical protein